MKNVIFALILIVGSFGYMSALADTNLSIGWSIGHHGDIITHFGISETLHYQPRHYRHQPRHYRHHYYGHHDYGHQIHWRDIQYYHNHGIHRHCSHH